MSISITACNRTNSDSESDNFSEMQDTEDSDNQLWKEDARVQNALESGAPTLVVSNEKVKPGESIVVNIYLVNNPGILGMTVTLSYDEDKVILKDVKNGDVFENVLELSKPEKLISGCNFMWSGEHISQEQVSDGLIMRLAFEAKKNIKDRTPIILLADQNGIYDNDLSAIKLEVENGMIEIEE